MIGRFRRVRQTAADCGICTGVDDGQFREVLEVVGTGIGVTCIIWCNSFRRQVDAQSGVIPEGIPQEFIRSTGLQINAAAAICSNTVACSRLHTTDGIAGSVILNLHAVHSIAERQRATHIQTDQVALDQVAGRAG